jgi:hypothetical protein
VPSKSSRHLNLHRTEGASLCLCKAGDALGAALQKLLLLGRYLLECLLQMSSGQQERSTGLFQISETNGVFPQRTLASLFDIFYNEAGSVQSRWLDGCPVRNELLGFVSVKDSKPGHSAFTDASAVSGSSTSSGSPALLAHLRHKNE